VVELGMNHPARSRCWPAGRADGGAGQQRAARAPGVHGHRGGAARENGAVIEALPADGTAVFPADDDFTPLWRQLAGARRVLTFARRPADVTPPAPPGRPAHWAVRACTRRPATPRHAALWPACTTSERAGRRRLRWRRRAAGRSAQGCDLPAGEGPPRVLRAVAQGGRFTLVDDSYNANPDSVRAAIDVLAGCRGPRWLLLGDMGEVGDQGPAFHAEVGAYARQRGIEQLW
jgi:UDP-N-acetylmuramoyl-tripeptide--D-alanyl-D-alanine ligase